ncbi:MAG: glycosyltransferase family 2 protein [Planctomycetota bacterium]|nr:glycosyltransferase family 2 protein [Planctomycetota bacterium]
MPKLSAIIPCKNEEKNIRACLETVRWADEIMVVDSGSSDRTLEIAREFTDRILSHPYVNSAAQKNWAIPQAAHEWVLIVDCDERVTPALRAEIQNLLATSPECDGYRIRRDNWFFGQRIYHCGWDGDDVLRLFRRDVGRYENKHVHADVVVPGKVGWLQGRLEHHTYRSFDQYLEKFGRYTTWGALDLRAQGVRTTAWHLIARPLFRFLRMYIWRRGFLDGQAGLILCGLAAFNVFMKYAKLWAIRRAEAGEAGVEIGRTEW